VRIFAVACGGAGGSSKTFSLGDETRMGLVSVGNGKQAYRGREKFVGATTVATCT